MPKNKNKSSRSRSKLLGDEESPAQMCGGPVRVLLLRHGESMSNATGDDMPDPPLTQLGRTQVRGSLHCTPDG
eukprot:7058311-Pyramimonas_sp.AAC.1